MTGDVVHIWGVVGESEMSSQRLAEIQFLDISEMFIESQMKGAFGLAYIL